MRRMVYNETMPQKQKPARAKSLRIATKVAEGLAMPLTSAISKTPERNDRLVDIWSFVHLTTGVVFGWIMAPLAALLIMAAWEPLEIFVLSPLLARAGITFGYESWRNSLSDIIFDALGIIIGAVVVRHFLAAPVTLF